jgi:glycolate oxidase FAD binding subunit
VSGPPASGSTPSAPIGELAEVIGGQHVHVGTSADGVDGCVPQWVARPGSVEDVQSVLRFADRHRLAVVPTGFGGHLDAGGAARALDLVVSLGRLDHVIDHVAGDMTVTVEAGCSLGDLDDRLAGADQWLPVDPPFSAETSVGGLVAANLSGPLRASQGTVRDYLIGIKTVTGDGQVVSGGGRVVKNVAGYDLPKLHVGALGTLGILVEATFKVRPRPGSEAALCLTAAHPAAVVDLAFRLRDLREPGWLEIAGPGTLGREIVIALGFLGTDAEVQAAIDEVKAVFGENARSARDAAADLRQTIVESARGAAVLRVSTLPSDLETLLPHIPDHEGIRWHAHATVGTVRIGIRDAEEVVDLLRQLRPRAEAVGGSVVVERGTPAVKQALKGELAMPPPAFELMRGVKSALDPGGRLAPGRLLGGI